MARTLVVVCVLTILCAGSALAAGVDPLPTFVFQLNVGGQPIFIKDCTPIGSETEVVTVIDGSSNIVRKLPGRTNYLNIKCSRGFTIDTTFASWQHDVETGATSAIRNGTLTLLDTSLTPFLTFNLINAWPNSLAVNGTEDATGHLVLTEDVSIVVDRITRQ